MPADHMSAAARNQDFGTSRAGAALVLSYLDQAPMRKGEWPLVAPKRTSAGASTCLLWALVAYTQPGPIPDVVALEPKNPPMRDPRIKLSFLVGQTRCAMPINLAGRSRPGPSAAILSFPLDDARRAPGTSADRAARFPDRDRLRAVASGSASAAATARLSLAMTSIGAPLGTQRPRQVVI